MCRCPNHYFSFFFFILETQLIAIDEIFRVNFETVGKFFFSLLMTVVFNMRILHIECWYNLLIQCPIRKL